MRAAFLDVDGTLTKGKNVWERVHESFGTLDQSRVYYEKAKRKEITYEEWANLDVALWKGRRFGDFINAIFPMDLVEDAAKGVEYLKRNFDYVILVSGGIDVLVEDVKRRVGAHYAIANSVKHLNNAITGEIEINVGNSKYDVIRELAHDFELDLEMCGAIGDDFNDIEMFENVGASIAFNSKSKGLDSVASRVLHSPTFMDAAKLLVELVDKS